MERVKSIEGVQVEYVVEGRAVHKQVNSKEMVSVIEKSRNYGSYRPERKRGFRIIVTIP